MKDITIKQSMDVLIHHLRVDEGYRLSWVANIAMSFKDIYSRSDNKEDIHKIANEASEEFIKLLIK